MLKKRIIIATIIGFLCGIICWKLATSNGVLPFGVSLSMILGRTLLGFGIGISCLKLSWWLHGLILGVIFSIPMAFGSLMVPENAIFIFIGTIVLGAIYGIIIELVTSVLFKARQS